MYRAVKSFILTALYALFFFLIYQQVYHPTVYNSDIHSHINLIHRIHEAAYPLWHYGVLYTSKLLGVSILNATVIFTPLVIVWLFGIILYILEHYLKIYPLGRTAADTHYILLFTSLALLISTAVYWPLFSKNMYIGQPGCGVWHNVTLLMVKPFAFLALFFSLLFFQTKKRRFFFGGIVVTLLSIAAKPSFIIVFIPALYIYLLLVFAREDRLFFTRFSKIKTLFSHHKQALMYIGSITILSVVFLAVQYMMVFTPVPGAKSPIIIDLFGVWSLYTSSIPISLLLICAFPLGVLLILPSRRSEFYLLSLILFVISTLIFCIFAEGGSRYSHGNFGWSMLIALHLLFVASAIDFLRAYPNLPPWRQYLLSTLFSLHIISGIIYLGRILITGTYV